MVSSLKEKRARTCTYLKAGMQRTVSWSHSHGLTVASMFRSVKIASCDLLVYMRDDL